MASKQRRISALKVVRIVHVCVTSAYLFEKPTMEMGSEYFTASRNVRFGKSDRMEESLNNDQRTQ